MTDAVKGCLSELKKKQFADLSEVARLQGKIEAYENMAGFIKEKMQKGNLQARPPKQAAFLMPLDN